MNSDNYTVLSRVFTRSVLKKFATGKKVDDVYNLAVKLFITHPEKNTNGDNFELLYSILKNEYRNEYYYKNTLLNKLLLGVHSVNTTTALTELPVAESKADFVMINGKAVVYEIKTELDNLDRLDRQLSSYYRAFNHVCVLSCESNAETILSKYRDTAVGVYVISSRETIRRLKEPIEDNGNLSLETMFQMLRKHEYENILLTYYSKLPKVSQYNYYNNCLDLFQELGRDNVNVYDAVLKELKRRNHISSDTFTKIPKSLKALSYFSELTPSQYTRLHSNLTLNY